MKLLQLKWCLICETEREREKSMFFNLTISCVATMAGNYCHYTPRHWKKKTLDAWLARANLCCFIRCQNSLDTVADKECYVIRLPIAFDKRHIAGNGWPKHPFGTWRVAECCVPRAVTHCTVGAWSRSTLWGKREQDSKRLGRSGCYW